MARKRERVHVIAVRWTFAVPVSRAEARAAVRDILPISGLPDRALWVRDGDVEECDITARLATKREAGDA